MEIDFFHSDESTPPSFCYSILLHYNKNNHKKKKKFGISYEKISFFYVNKRRKMWKREIVYEKA